MGVSLFSCKKNKNTPIPIKSTPIPIGMTAVVNSANWVATNYGAYIDTVNDTMSLHISGSITYPALDYFDLIVSNYKGTVGAFNVSFTITGAFIAYSYNYGHYDASSGSITLTQVSSSNVEGTFICTFPSSTYLTITNGQFNVPMQ